MRYRCSALAPNVRRSEGRVKGLGVGCVGWGKQRPQHVQCAGRVGSIGGGEGFQQVGNGRQPLIGSGPGNSEA